MDFSISSERAGRVEQLFEEAVELAPEERTAYLDQACGDDVDLRREVESLLAAFDAHAADVLGVLEGLPLASLPPAQAAVERDTRGLAGRCISHYDILEKLGGGGMGVVYKARDTKLDRTVALKFLPPHLSFNEEAKVRFVREAQAASALDHVNICTIYEIDETPASAGAGGQLFIAMAYYAGETLKKKIARGPLSVEEAVAYAVQMAEGLARAHEAGIVHRDVKPANVMVTERGQAKLVDFGLAKVQDVSLTQTGMTLGTVAYMSPEQARGEAVDERADVWSLGVVLYEMLTGERPFRGDFPQAVIYSILNEEPERLTNLRPEVPEKLACAVEKALAKAPEARYQSMDALLADLKPLDEVSPPSRPAAGPAPAQRAPGRRVAIYGSAALLLALLVVAGGIHFFTGGDQQIDAIAVLPLVNLSADPEQEYFADGMTEALIAELAQIQALEKVISRQSVMRFKDSQTPLPEIARALGVDAVVEGSVVRSGDRVRITAQLIQGRTERHLWAKSYERDLSDILALQREMAMAIAREVEAELTPEERTRMSESRRVDPEAYELYLRGRHFREQDTPEAYERARAYFEQAVAKDSAFAEAYAGLGTVYALMGLLDVLPQEEAQAKARQAVERALALDETSWEAHLARRFTSDRAGAERAHRRAIELNPNSREAHREYGRFLSGMGRFEEGLSELRRAVELDPLSVQALTSLADGYNWSRQHERAIEQAQKALELDPNHALAHFALGDAYLAKGRYAEAIAAYEKVEAIWGSRPFSSALLGYAYAMSGRRSEALEEIEALKAQRGSRWSDGGIALVYTALGEKEEALDWLERAYEEGSGLGPRLKVDFMYDPLRSEPRFQALLKKVELEQ